MFRTNRGFLFILMLLLCNAASFAQQQKLPNSLLWRITGNGLQKPSYLYGTMHLQDKRLFQFGDSLYSAIEQTDGLAIEIDIREYLDSVITNAIAGQEKEAQLEKQTVKLDRRKVDKVTDSLLKKFGIKGTTISKKELKRIRDYRMQKLLSEGEMPTIMDAYLYGLALRQGKWVGAVEDVADQLGLLDELGSELKPESVLQPDVNYRSGFESMIKIYTAQDLAAIEEMTSGHFSPGDKDILLIKRNLKMARRIDSLGKLRSIFFAVGAAHLPGDSGVIALLKEKGFAMEPVFSSSTISADVYAAKLKQLDWTTVQDNDSAYAVKMPGKPSDYDMYGDAFKMRMFFDITTMTVYFSGSSLAPATSETMLEEGMQNMARRWNMPLSALKTKVVSRAGLVGKEALFENEQGNYKVQLLYKDKRVFMLMVGSQRKAALTTPETDRFFASLTTFDKPAATRSWKKFELPGKGIAVSIPGAFKPNEKIDKSIDSSTGWVYKTYDFTDAGKGIYYMMQVREVSPGSYMSGDSAYFEELKAGYNNNDLHVTSATPATFQGYPAVYINAAYEKDIVYKTFHVIRGNRVYSILAGGSKNSGLSDIDSFLHSFTLLPYQQVTWAPSSIGGISSVAPSPLIEAFVDDSAAKAKGRIHLQSYNAAEAVTYDVFIDPFSPLYWIKNDSSYFTAQRADYVGYKDSLLKMETVYNGTIKGIDLVVQMPDNNNLKKVRLLVSGDSLYTLVSFFPSQLVNDEQHLKFFNDFRISNERPPTIYTSKTPQLMAALKSKDSAAFANATEDYSVVSFQKEDLPYLHTALLENYYDSLEDYNTNHSLVTTLIPLADSATVDFIAKHYGALNGNKEPLKYHLLHLLASMKTASAYAVLKKLLITSLPMQGNVEFLSTALTDSLLLTQTLFPEILVPGKDSLFAPVVVGVTNWLLDSNALLLSDVLPYKANFLAGAKKGFLDLKREGAGYEWKATKWINFLGRIDDKEGNALLQQFLANKSTYIKYDAILALVKNNHLVSPAEIAKVAADRSERASFYEALKEIGKQKLFTLQYATQKSLAESELYGFLSDDYEVGPIVFIGERIADYKGAKQKFYLFKVRLNYDDEDAAQNYLAVTGPYGPSSKKLVTYTDASGIYEDETYTPAKTEKLFRAYLAGLTPVEK